MGRKRRQYYGKTELPRDRGKPGTTEESVTKFADSSPGPVASMMWANNLLRYDAAGELRIDRAGVKKEVASINATGVNTREYPREKYEQYAVESTGLTKRKAVNASDREMKVRAQAVLIAAKAAGVEVTPAQKRILNPLAEGRFTQTVYGKKGEHDEGTLNTRLNAAKKPGVNSRDAAQRARARQKADELREYRYGDSSRYRAG